MDYENKNIEDFLIDPEFRSWVLKPTDASNFFWKKWLQANPQQKEKALAAREIIMRAKYEKIEKFSEEEKEELLNKVLGENPKSNNQKKDKYRNYLLIAASIMVIVSSFLFLNYEVEEAQEDFQWKQIVKENNKGQKSRITLPDGSTVWLNSDSRISYASKFIDKREITLEGEAFFEVKKDSLRPFIVNSNGLLTKALGTSFNIRAYQNDEVEVGLVTGKIAVNPEFNIDNKVIVNVPMAKVTYDLDGSKLDISSYDDLSFYKWTERTLVFKATEFKEIEEMLERWYDVDITIHNLNGRKISYTGEFRKESLESILERMAFVEKFSFRIEGKESKKVSINFE